MKTKDKEKIDGYISKIQLEDKVYALRCEIVEIYATTCPKCGGNITLKFGTGKCDYCGTSYTTQFKMIET